MHRILPRFRLVDEFTSVMDQDIKDTIIDKFTSPSQLRIVIATTAFGMGVNCPDVREVIHVGIPDDTEEYMEETGRVGRDGLSVLAMLTSDIKEKIYFRRNVGLLFKLSKCRRDKLFQTHIYTDLVFVVMSVQNVVSVGYLIISNFYLYFVVHLV